MDSSFKHHSEALEKFFGLKPGVMEVSLHLPLDVSARFFVHLKMSDNFGYALQDIVKLVVIFLSLDVTHVVTVNKHGA